MTAAKTRAKLARLKLGAARLKFEAARRNQSRSDLIAPPGTTDCDRAHAELLCAEAIAKATKATGGKP